MSQARTDTTAADRYAFDNTREVTQALARMGKLSEEELRDMEADRTRVGAKPLRRDDIRHFDSSGVTPAPELSPEAIRALREREGASQAVLAKYLGVAVATLGQWERGQRKPQGPALRLLSLVQRHGLDYVR